MNVKFNDNVYPLKQNIYNKPVAGYIYKGNIVPSISKGMKELGVIETEMGHMSIVRRKRTPILAVLAILLLLYVGYFTITHLPQNMGAIKYAIKFNDSMTWDEGRVNINLVNGEVEVQVSIQGEDFLSAPITIRANESLVYYPLEVVFPKEANDVKVIYTIEGKDYTYDAKVKAVSFGEEAVPNIPNEQHPPTVDEVIVE